MFPRLEPGHRHALTDRCPKAFRVGDEVIDDLVFWHESIGIISAVPAARQLDRPVRDDEAEAVPAPTPGLANPAPLENDVVNTSGRELVTQRKPSLPSTDDHGVDGRLHRLPPRHIG